MSASFATTRWTLVLAAGAGGGDGDGGENASASCLSAPRLFADQPGDASRRRSGRNAAAPTPAPACVTSVL
jgi:hypothetical protein